VQIDERRLAELGFSHASRYRVTRDRRIWNRYPHHVSDVRVPVAHPHVHQDAAEGDRDRLGLGLGAFEKRGAAPDRGVTVPLLRGHRGDHPDAHIQHLTSSASRSTGASRRRISSARCLGVGERLSPIMAPRGTRARRRGARGAGSRAWPARPAGSPPGSSTRRTPPGATGREPRSWQRRIPRNTRTA